MNTATPAPRASPPAAAFWGLAAFGLFLVVLGLHAEWFIQMSADWEPVPAQVTVSETTSVQRSGRQSIRYLFAYRYIRDGKMYEGARYSYRGRMHEGVSQYQRGDIITAYVSPDDPAFSVIARDLKWWDRLYAPFGMLIILAALYRIGRERQLARRA